MCAITRYKLLVGQTSEERLFQTEAQSRIDPPGPSPRVLSLLRPASQRLFAPTQAPQIRLHAL